MHVTTKFNIGDNVWAMVSNKVKQFKITGIEFASNRDETVVVYKLLGDYCTLEFDECAVFATKLDLINSL